VILVSDVFGAEVKKGGPALGDPVVLPWIVLHDPVGGVLPLCALAVRLDALADCFQNVRNDGVIPEVSEPNL